ncbi:glycosyltransferase family 2 protein [Hominifimenecus sp. rT4P-3]|uniref:glycosyltransferase family 2 protein n=1 Tax=Hominifimenecus sp. rT4P-3 TaxID=3242979 RepID=UPI003DA2698D
MESEAQDADVELISVIMPVYNLDAYLKRAIESVLCQTYPNWELILIDDGSVDQSGVICDEYSQNDSRIRVFHQENHGAAVARNRGVQESSGEYIAFVDGDDWISADYLDFLLHLLKQTNARMAACGYQKVFSPEDRGSFEEEGQICTFCAEEALHSMLYRKVMTNFPCVKLLERQIVVENPFPEGRLYEDLAVVYRWYACGTVAYHPARKYFYLQRPGSSMHSHFEARKWDLIEISEEIQEFIREHYPELQKAADSRMFVSCLQILRLLPYGKAYREKRRELGGRIRRLRWEIWKDKENKMETRLMALASFGGVHLLALFGRLYDWRIRRFHIHQKY